MLRYRTTHLHHHWYLSVGPKPLNHHRPGLGNVSILSQYRNSVPTQLSHCLTFTMASITTAITYYTTIYCSQSLVLSSHFKHNNNISIHSFAFHKNTSAWGQLWELIPWQLTLWELTLWHQVLATWYYIMWLRFYGCRKALVGTGHH